MLAAVLTVLVLILLPPTSHELIHWLILVGMPIGIYKYDVVDGISMDLP